MLEDAVGSRRHPPGTLILEPMAPLVLPSPPPNGKVFLSERT